MSASTLPEESRDISVRPFADGKTDDVFGKLYKHFKDEGIRFAQRRGAEDPEGLFDQVFVDVMAKIDTLSEPTGDAFAAYLFRSIGNRVIQEHRRKPPPTEELVEEIAQVPQQDAPFDDEVVEADFVASLLDQLTPAQRDVIVHRFLNGHNSIETAALLDTSPDAVRQLQRSAIRRLRSAISITVAVILVIFVFNAIRQAGPDPIPSDPVQSTPTSPSSSTIDDGSAIRSGGSDDQQQEAPNEQALPLSQPGSNASWVPDGPAEQRAVNAPARLARAAKKTATTVPASSTTSSSWAVTTTSHPAPVTSTTIPTPTYSAPPASTAATPTPTAANPTTSTSAESSTSTAPSTVETPSGPTTTVEPPPSGDTPTPPTTENFIVSGEDGVSGADGVDGESDVSGETSGDPEGLGTTTTMATAEVVPLWITAACVGAPDPAACHASLMG